MPEQRKRRRLRGCLAALVVSLLVIVPGVPLLVAELGGAFTHRPGEMAEGLSPGARALLARALDGLDDGRLYDYHVHLVGLGTSGSGAYVSDEMRSWWHLTKRIRFEVYTSASGITDLDHADEQYVERLAALVRGIPDHGRHLLLAFDRYYGPDGRADPARTEFYVPNDYAFAVAEAWPDLFEAAASVHPYRPDALSELERCRKRGARVVKWLPNAMGIDPADPRCDPFYAKLKSLDMVLLSHAGDEQAVDGAEAQGCGNPLRLRRALDAGVTVIVAHCASLGRGEDLDDPAHPLRDNFDLFLRLMDEKRYEGRLFGEISGLTQSNRMPRPLLTLLNRRDLHPRLVNGSDYPIPAINVLVRTREIATAGLITEEERGWINEIYDYNPLLFDLVLKRTVRLPGSREGFPASVFTRRVD